MKFPKFFFCLFLLLLSAAFLSACKQEDMTVIDQNGKTIRVSATADGSYAFKLPSQQSLPEEDWKNPFIDVAKGSWYYDAIRYCYENGIMFGTSSTTFSPDRSTSRGMIVATIWRMEGSPTIGQNPFLDVPADAYYADAVAWAASHGIVDGYSETLFGPEDAITREQLAAILYRYAAFQSYDTKTKASLSSFEDAFSASAYAEDALSWAVAEDIVHGADGLLMPRGEATRAQVASIWMNWCENFAK